MKTKLVKNGLMKKLIISIATMVSAVVLCFTGIKVFDRASGVQTKVAAADVSSWDNFRTNLQSSENTEINLTSNIEFSAGFSLFGFYIGGSSYATIPSGYEKTVNGGGKTITINVRDSESENSSRIPFVVNGSLKITNATIKIGSSNSTINNTLFNVGSTGRLIIGEGTSISGFINSNNDTTGVFGNIQTGAIYNNGGVVTVEGGTISGNTGNLGGAIQNNGGTVNISGGTITANESGSGNGGAIYSTGGSINISGGTISGHEVSGNGGAIFAENTAITMSAGTITDNSATANDNSATANGGAIYLSNGSFSMTGGTISKNGAVLGGGVCTTSATEITVSGGNFIENGNGNTTNGGAIYIGSSSGAAVTASGATFDNNTAQSSGGAIYIQNRNLTVDGSTFTQNGRNFNQGNVVNGGAIYANSSNLTVSNSNFGTSDSDYNFASGNGGAIYIDSANTLELVNTNFKYNGASLNGGAIYSKGGITIDGGTIQGNKSTLAGVIYTTSTDDMVLSSESANLVISNNTSSESGLIYSQGNILVGNDGTANTIEVNSNNVTGDGVIYAGKKLEIYKGLFDGNTVSNNGIVYATEGLEVSGATFTNNTASGEGSILACAENIAIEKISNATFTANTAKNGIVYTQGNNTKTLTVSNSTFTNNNGSGNASVIYAPKGQNVTLENVTITNTGDSINNTNTAINMIGASGTKLNVVGGNFENLGSAGKDGGVIYATNTAIAISSNAKFSGNKAKVAGAIYAGNGCTLTLNGGEFAKTNNEIYLANGNTFTMAGAAKVMSVVTVADTGATPVVSITSQLTQTENLNIKFDSSKYALATKLITVAKDSNKQAVVSASKITLVDDTKADGAVLINRTSEANAYIEYGGVVSGQVINNIDSISTKALDLQYGETYGKYITKTNPFANTGLELVSVYFKDGSDNKVVVYNFNDIDEQIYNGVTLFTEWEIVAPTYTISNATATFNPFSDDNSSVNLVTTITNLNTDLLTYNFTWYKVATTDQAISTGVVSSNGVSTLTIATNTFESIGTYNYYCKIDVERTGYVKATLPKTSNTTVTVNKLAVTLSLVDNSAVYTGSAIDILDLNNDSVIENISAKRTSDSKVITDSAKLTNLISNMVFTNNSQTVVGTYTLSVAEGANSNYSLSIVSVPYEITKKYVTLDFIKASTEYTASAIDIKTDNVTVIVTDGIAVNYSDIASSITWTNNQKTNAGTYTASFTMTNANFALTNSSLNYEITPVSLSIDKWVIENGGTTAYTDSSFTYDGAKKSVYVVFSGLKGTDTVTTSYTGNENVDAGSYTTTITGISGAKANNYVIYNIANLSKEWKINKATVTAVWNYSNTPFTYDGQTKTVEVEKLLNSKTSQELDMKEFSLTYTANSYIDANETGYTATITDLGNPNYTIGTNQNLTWIINKRVLTITEPTTKAVTYDGQKHTMDYTLGNIVTGDTVNLVSTYSDATRVDAGSYTTTASSLTGTNAKNYKLPTGTNSFDWTIDKRVVDVDGWYVMDTHNFYAEAFTYNSENQGIEIKFIGINDDDTNLINANIIYSNNEKEDAGEYQAQVTGLSSAVINYTITGVQASSLTKDWEISAKEVTLAWSGNGGTYNGTAKTISADIETGMISGDDLSLILSNQTETNAGDYTATATLNGGDKANYVISTATSSYGWSIAKKDLTIVWNKLGTSELYTSAFTYTGSAQGIEAIVQGLENNETLSVGNYNNNTATNAGTYTASIVDSSLTGTADLNNYNIVESTTSKEWKINKATATIAWNYSQGLTYTGSAQTVTATATPNIALTYTNNSGTVVGDYTATVESDNSNYDLTGGNYSLNWSIVPAQVTITWPTRNLTYTANNIVFVTAENNISISGSATSVLSGKYEIENNTNKTAGTYTAKFVIDESIADNYEITNETCDYTIKPAVAIITWNYTTPFTYDSSNKTVTATIATLGSDAQPTITYTGNIEKNASDSDYVATITALSDNNYTLTGASNTTLNWKINKKDITVAYWYIDADKTIYSSAFVYDGTLKTVQAGLNGVVGGDVVNITYSNNTKTSAGTYQAVVESIDNTNYNLTDTKSLDWSIGTKTISINWNNESSYTYTGSVQSFNPQVAGIETSDSDKVTITITGNSGTDAGDYTATVQISGENANNYVIAGAAGDKKSLSLDWTINKMVIKSISWDSEAKRTFVYDSANHSIAPISVLDQNNEEIADIVFTYANNVQKNAGSYTVKITDIDGKSNYTIEGMTDETQLSSTLIITPITAEFELYTTAGLTTKYTTPYVYTGSAQSVFVKISNLVAGDTNPTITTTGNTYTNAGSYTLTVAKIDSVNYVLSQTASENQLVWEIEKQQITIAWKLDNEDITSVVYDGTEHKMVAIPSVDGVAIAYTGNTAETQVAGNYSATATSANDNYVLTGTNLTQAWSITPKSISFAENTGLTYNGANQTLFVTLSGVCDGDYVTALYDGEESKTGKLASEYTATITLSGNDKANYTLSKTEANWTIAKANLTIKGSTTTTFDYNGKVQNPTVEVEGLKGNDSYQVTYTLGGVASESIDASATSYVMTVVVDNAGSYNITRTDISESNTITYTILKATPTIDIVNISQPLASNTNEYFLVLINGVNGKVSETDGVTITSGETTILGNLSVYTSATDDKISIATFDSAWGTTTSTESISNYSAIINSYLSDTTSFAIFGVKTSGTVISTTATFANNSDTNYVESVKATGEFNITDNLAQEALVVYDENGKQVTTDTLEITKTYGDVITLYVGGGTELTADKNADTYGYGLFFGGVAYTAGETKVSDYLYIHSIEPMSDGKAKINILATATVESFSMVAYKASGVDADSKQYAEAYGSTIKFTIKKREIGLTVSDSTKVFGSADPAFAATVTDQANLVQNLTTTIGTDKVGDIYATDLEVNYTNPTADTTFSRTEGESVGTYDITATSYTNANYELGTVTNGKLTISAKSVVNVNDITVIVSNANNIVFDGTEKTPEITVIYDGKTLVQGVDYTAPEYDDNVNQSNIAKVTISLTGNYSSEAKETNFTIKKAQVSQITFGAISDKTFTGTAVSVTESDFTAEFGDYSLVESDYAITTNFDSNINVGTYTVTIAGGNNFEGTTTLTYKIVAEDISKVTNLVATATNNTYSGNEISVSSIAGSLNGYNLTNNTDFVITGYSNNINVGNAAKVTIAGIGNFKGTKELTFEIVAKALVNSDIKISIANTQIFSNSQKTPKFTASYGDIKLVDNSDFGTITYGENINAGTNAGTIKFVLKGNYSGTITKTFDIEKLNIDSNVKVEGIGNKTYNGLSQTQSSIVLKFGEATISKDEYEVTYDNNTNVGTAFVTITMKADSTNYTGSVEEEFEITQKAFNGNETDFTIADIASVVYTGKAFTVSDFDISIKYGQTDLVFGRDYNYIVISGGSYTDTNAGTGAIQISFVGNFSGQTTKEYTIEQRAINQGSTTNEVGEIEISGIQNKGYENVTHTQNVTVKFNLISDVTLVQGTDYEVSYEVADRKNVGTYTVIITGKGNFKGEVTKTYVVSAHDITNSQYITIDSIADLVYNGKEKTPTITMTYAPTEATKETVSASNYELKYSDHIENGTATITVTAKGNFVGTKTVTFDINRLSVDGLNVLEQVDSSQYVNENIYVSYETKSFDYDGTEKTLADLKVVYYNDGTTVELVEGVDFDVEYADNTNATGTPKLTITFVNNLEGSKEIGFTISRKPLTNSDVAIEFNDSVFYYTGKAIEPTFTAKYNDVVLGIEKVEYANNTQVGTANISFDLTGNYSGTITTTFEIEKRPYSQGGFTVSEIDTQRYDGTAKTPDFTIDYEFEDYGYTLVKDTDYTVTYTNNIAISTSAKIVVEFKGAYFTGNTTIEFEIGRVPLTNADLTISAIASQQYTGEAITLNKNTISVVITETNVTLGANNFDVTYRNNINLTTAESKAVAVITFKNNFAGTAEVEFDIVPRTLDTTNFTYQIDETEVIYTGVAVDVNSTVVFTLPTTDYTLVEGTDYNVTYSASPINVGRYSVNVVGTGKFSGTVTIGAFDVVQKQLNDTEFTFVNANEKEIYNNGTEITKSNIEFYFGQTKLTEGTDYTVSYANNKVVGTATITVTGKGNFKGEIQTTFSIVAKTLIGADITMTVVSDVTYTGEQIKPEFVLTYNGINLQLNKDYQNVEFGTNIDVATGGIVSFELMGNYAGDIDKIFAIKAKDINTLNIGQLNKETYTGEMKTPDVTIMFGETKLVNTTDYTLSYENNQNVGIATVTITGKGNYSGTRTANFEIVKGSYSGINYEGQITLTYSDDLNGKTLDDIKSQLAENYKWANPSIVLISDNGFTSGDTEKQFVAYYNADPANYEDYAVQVTVRLNKANYQSIENVNITAPYIKNMTVADLVDDLKAKSADYRFVDTTKVISGVNKYGAYEYGLVYNANPNFYNDYTQAIAVVTIVKGTYSNEYAAYNSVIYTTYAYGKTLNDIELKQNYSWNNSSEQVGSVTAEGRKFVAIFNDDVENFNNIEVEVTIIVEKADFVINDDATVSAGEFDVPEITNSVAYSSRLTLADIELPEGFVWNDSAMVLTKGTHRYMATYNGIKNQDSQNYEGNYNPYTEVQVYITVVAPELEIYAVNNGQKVRVEMSYGEFVGNYNIDELGLKVFVKGTNEEVELTSLNFRDQNQILTTKNNFEDVQVVVRPVNTNYVQNNTTILNLSVYSVITKVILSENLVQEFADETVQYGAKIAKFGENYPTNGEYSSLYKNITANGMVRYTYQKGNIVNGQFVPESTNVSEFTFTTINVGVYRIVADLSKTYLGFTFDGENYVEEVSKIVTVEKKNITIYLNNGIKNYGTIYKGLIDTQDYNLEYDNLESLIQNPFARKDETVTKIYKLNANGTFTDADEITTTNPDGVFAEFNKYTAAGKYAIVVSSTSDNYNMAYQNNTNPGLTYAIFEIKPVELSVDFDIPGGLVAKGGDLASKVKASLSGFVFDEDKDKTQITFAFYLNGDRVEKVNKAGDYTVRVILNNSNYFVEETGSFHVAPDLTGMYIGIVAGVIGGVAAIVIVAIIIFKKRKSTAISRLKNEQVNQQRLGQADMINKLRKGEEVSVGSKELTKEQIKAEMKNVKKQEKDNKK